MDLLDKILNEVKQDKDIKDRKGTEPAKYYAKDAEGKKTSVSTKKARDTHFTKKKKGPAPGDADATTKPSTHTKKFKKMYGEAKAVAGGKVHKFIKGHNLPIDGKKYKSVYEYSLVYVLRGYFSLPKTLI